MVSCYGYGPCFPAFLQPDRLCRVSPRAASIHRDVRPFSSSSKFNYYAFNATTGCIRFVNDVVAVVVVVVVIVVVVFVVVAVVVIVVFVVFFYVVLCSPPPYTPFLPSF